MIFASPPFCTGYAYHAARHAKARIAAQAGLCVAGLELVSLVTLMVIRLLG